MEFGFFPENLDLAHGQVTVSTLPDFSSSKNKVQADSNIRDGWIYPGNAETRLLGGGIRSEPYAYRIFGLPKTHAIEHANADGEQHLKFHIWALSFFVGMRLTSEEAGFLDTTPIKKGALVDFVVIDKLDRTVELAEKIWINNITCPEQIKRISAAIHSLFLSHNRQALRFEQFQYVYMALEACFAMLWQKHKNGDKPNHAKRLSWMCEKLDISIPTWAAVDDEQAKKTEVSGLRNDAFHEALFAGEPFGFAIDGAGSSQNLVLEMQNLTCRILVGLLGVTDTQYLKSAVNDRQIKGVRLSS
jgi:hypothetical protein